MPTEPQSQSPSVPDSAEAQETTKRPLSPAAERDRKAGQAKESGGRGGLDPTRYGDWEKDGLISDF
jgi:hypothetical protein